MTRKQIFAMARFVLDQLPTDWIKATDSNLFSLSDALDLAYNKYAIETECFPVTYTLAATASQAEYRYDAFGTGSPKSGARMFKINYVAYDSREISESTRADIARSDPNWRFSSAGTPLAWFPSGERRFQLWPKPVGVLNIVVEGFETPDLTSFTTDAAIPDIHVGDHRLLALETALLPLMRDPENENLVRATSFYQELQAGYKAARKRIHGAGRASIIVGRNSSGSDYPKSLLGRFDPAV